MQEKIYTLQPLDEERTKALVEGDPQRHPGRALTWAWYRMKKYPFQSYTFFDSLEMLQRYRDEYYKFLDDHGLEKTLYDKHIKRLHVRKKPSYDTTHEHHLLQRDDNPEERD